jgi:hypothetical protein
MPLLTNDHWREKLEPKHRPRHGAAWLFVGCVRVDAGVIGSTGMNAVRRNLAMQPVQWRWSICRFYTAWDRYDDPALPKLWGLPSEISRPITCALRTTSRSTGSKLPSGTRTVQVNTRQQELEGRLRHARCVARIVTVWDFNERTTGGSPPSGPQHL